MKKNIKLNGKLSFNKETIANLNDDQMNNIEGGYLTYTVTCHSCDIKTGCPEIETMDCPKITDSPCEMSVNLCQMP